MIAEIYKIFKENNYATFGVCIYLLFIIVAIFADLIATNDPPRINFSRSGLVQIYLKLEYFQKQTSNGRDIFSNLFMAQEMALAVVGALAAVIRTIVGLISGFTVKGLII